MCKKIQKLPDAELDIMLVLWECDEPTKANEILDKLSGTRNWSLSTVYSMLDRLCERGFTQMSYVKRFRFYKAIIKKSEYEQLEKKNILKNFFDNSPSRLVASFISSSDLTGEDIEQLEKLLEAKRN